MFHAEGLSRSPFDDWLDDTILPFRIAMSCFSSDCRWRVSHSGCGGRLQETGSKSKCARASGEFIRLHFCGQGPLLAHCPALFGSIFCWGGIDTCYLIATCFSVMFVIKPLLFLMVLQVYRNATLGFGVLDYLGADNPRRSKARQIPEKLFCLQSLANALSYTHTSKDFSEALEEVRALEVFKALLGFTVARWINIF